MHTMHEHDHLIDEFSSTYKLVTRSDPGVMRGAYRLRHQVFCEELRYFPENDLREETDRFDPISLHVVLRSKNSSRASGYIRVIPASAQGQDVLLPTEQRCHDLDQAGVAWRKLPRQTISEVSRLCIAPSERSGASIDTRIDGSLQQGLAGHRTSLMAMALYIASATLANRHHIDYMMMMTDPQVARHVQATGFDIEPMGPQIQDFGGKTPFIVSTRLRTENIAPSVQHMLRFVERCLGL